MKTTKEMFEAFTKECLRLQKVLNLLNWSIYFDHTKLKDAVAMCEGNSEGCVATISLNTDTGSTPIDPVECAKHEVWHLFFWRMTEIYGKRLNKVEKKALDGEIEKMVCVLEKLKILEEVTPDHTKESKVVSKKALPQKIIRK